MLPPATTVCTSCTGRGNAVLRVTAGSDPVEPDEDDHEIVQVTDTEPGHAAGRDPTPVRSRYTCAHAPGAAAWTAGDTPGTCRVPAPEQATGDESGSPGTNVNDGIAETVTHNPPAHSRSETAPVQFATSANTGTPTIDATPTAGDDTTTGCGNSRASRPRANAAKFAGVDGITQRNSNRVDPSEHRRSCHTTVTPSGGWANPKSTHTDSSADRSSGIVTQKHDTPSVGLPPSLPPPPGEGTSHSRQKPSVE